MEEWRDIEEFPGYQVSNQGRVRSFLKQKHRPYGYGCDWVIGDEPRTMSMSDDGNGYLKVCLTSKLTGKRYCRKVHKLVADAFIPKPGPDYTVDHKRSGREGKLDNSVSNLRWMTRADNIKKAYRDGMCDSRIMMSRKDIIATDLWTGKQFYFESIQEAANELYLDRTSISHVLRGDNTRCSHYTFEYAGREERLLYGNEDYKCYQRFSWV